MKAVCIALLIGCCLAAAWFRFCYFVSQAPVISPVSLALAFRPWWRHWEMGGALFLLPLAVWLIREAWLEYVRPKPFSGENLDQRGLG